MPIFFCLIHGIELLLKSILLGRDDAVPINHGCEGMIKHLDSKDDAFWLKIKSPIEEIRDVLKSIKGPLGAKNFPKIENTKPWSDGDFDSWYVSARYPVLTSGQAKKLTDGLQNSDSFVTMFLDDEDWEPLNVAVNKLWDASAKAWNSR